MEADRERQGVAEDYRDAERLARHLALAAEASSVANIQVVVEGYRRGEDVFIENCFDRLLIFSKNDRLRILVHRARVDLCPPI